MKKDEFENIFKDSFEDFEAEVSPNVWKNVQTALKGAGIGLLGKAVLNKIGANTLIAVVSSAAAVVGTVVVMNWGSKADPKPVATVEPTIKIENPKPAKVEEIRDFLSDKPAKPAVPAESKTPVKQDKNDSKANVPLTIKKDKIEEVISEYSKSMVASISASPIAGTVPLVVNVTNTGTGKINKWNFGDGQKDNNPNPVHVYDTPGLYTIALSSVGADGKTAVDSVRIEVTGNSSLASMPTSFSPNGDGDKDFFVFEKKNIVNMTAIIVDEKGKTIYIWDETHTKWDGKDLKGKPAKEGVYFYIQTAEGADGKKYEQKGSIRLTR